MPRKTRPLGAGTIIGSGTVSNRDVRWRAGQADPAGRPRLFLPGRAAHGRDHPVGRAPHSFLRFGDTVRIEMKDAQGHSIFGAIEQTVEEAAAGSIGGITASLEAAPGFASSRALSFRHDPDKPLVRNLHTRNRCDIFRNTQKAVTTSQTYAEKFLPKIGQEVDLTHSANCIEVCTIGSWGHGARISITRISRAFMKKAGCDSRVEFCSIGRVDWARFHR